MNPLWPFSVTGCARLAQRASGGAPAGASLCGLDAVSSSRRCCAFNDCPIEFAVLRAVAIAAGLGPDAAPLPVPAATTAPGPPPSIGLPFTQTMS